MNRSGWTRNRGVGPGSVWGASKERLGNVWGASKERLGSVWRSPRGPYEPPVISSRQVRENNLFESAFFVGFNRSGWTSIREVNCLCGGWSLTRLSLASFSASPALHSLGGCCPLDVLRLSRAILSVVPRLSCGCPAFLPVSQPPNAMLSPPMFPCRRQCFSRAAMATDARVLFRSCPVSCPVWLFRGCQVLVSVRLTGDNKQHKRTLSCGPCGNCSKCVCVCIRIDAVFTGEIQW